MAATIPELATRVIVNAHHTFDTLAKCREEAIRAREAAAEAALPRRALAALRAAYVSDRQDRRPPTAREALSALERRNGAQRSRRLAPLGTAAVAACALLIVVIVLAAPAAT